MRTPQGTSAHRGAWSTHTYHHVVAAALALRPPRVKCLTDFAVALLAHVHAEALGQQRLCSAHKRAVRGPRLVRHHSRRAGETLDDLEVGGVGRVLVHHEVEDRFWHLLRGGGSLVAV